MMGTRTCSLMLDLSLPETEWAKTGDMPYMHATSHSELEKPK